MEHFILKVLLIGVLFFVIFLFNKMVAFMVKLVNSILEVKYKSKSNRFYKGIIKNEQNIIKAFQYLYWFGFVVFACLILTSDLMNLIK